MNDFVFRITEDLLFRAAAGGTPRIVLRIAAELLFRAAAGEVSALCSTDYHRAVIQSSRR